MRAREPDHEGVVERDGVRVGYDVYGAGEPTIVLLTSWAIVHMRQWKAQVPYLSRHFRVITVEGRGNGRADRPGSAEAYADREYVDDAIAVMDATGTDRAVVVGLSMGGAARPAARRLVPGTRGGRRRDRDRAAVARRRRTSTSRRSSYEGWGKANRHYWLADYRGWVEFFMSQVFTEPHSIKQREDGVGWGLDTDAETLLLTTPRSRSATGRRRRGDLPSGALPGPGRPRRRGRDRAVRDRRGAGPVDRRGTRDDRTAAGTRRRCANR